METRSSAILNSVGKLNENSFNSSLFQLPVDCRSNGRSMSAVINQIKILYYMTHRLTEMRFNDGYRLDSPALPSTRLNEFNWTSPPRQLVADQTKPPERVLKHLWPVDRSGFSTGPPLFSALNCVQQKAIFYQKSRQMKNDHRLPISGFSQGWSNKWNFELGKLEISFGRCAGCSYDHTLPLNSLFYKALSSKAFRLDFQEDECAL